MDLQNKYIKTEDGKIFSNSDLNKIEFPFLSEFHKDLTEGVGNGCNVEFEILSDHDDVKIFKLKNLPIHDTDETRGGRKEYGQIIRKYQTIDDNSGELSDVFSFMLNEKYNDWCLSCIDINYTTDTFALWKYIE